MEPGWFLVEALIFQGEPDNVLVCGLTLSFVNLNFSRHQNHLEGLLKQVTGPLGQYF